MTDRVYALTVVLEMDIREDAIEPLCAAIRQLSGVVDVRNNVTDSALWTAKTSADQHWRNALITLAYSKSP